MRFVYLLVRRGEVSHRVYESDRRERLGGEGYELEISGPVALDVFEEAGEEIVCGCELGIYRGVRRHKETVLPATAR